MPSFNKVILMGNFTRDPELRFLPNNTAVCDMGLAINDRYQNKSTGQWEDRPNFVDCTAFGRTAENISKFFGKGRPIFIEGKLRFEQWEDRTSGQKRSKLKVVVDTWQFVDSKSEGGGEGRGDGGRPSSGYGNASANDQETNGGWEDGGGGGSNGGSSTGGHEPVEEDEIPF